MQLAAVDHVLRHRVALVQGAPGTGKTLLGVVLARIIKGTGKIDGPMLCVCYTNHALDQFLEDLAGHLSVVRCGGRFARNKVGGVCQVQNVVLYLRSVLGACIIHFDCRAKYDER